MARKAVPGFIQILTYIVVINKIALQELDDPYVSIRGKYAGASIAILGSGPSAPHLFSRKEDVVVGVNGAASLLHSGDFFLSDDSAAPKKSWFTKMPDNVTLIVTSAAAIKIPAIYPNPEQRCSLQSQYNNLVNTWLQEFPDFIDAPLDSYGRTDNTNMPRKSSDGCYYLLPEHPSLHQFERTLPKPTPPHVVLKYRSHSQPYSRKQLRINMEGTSVHTAVQLAYLMGAHTIHLYGVEFSNAPVAGQPYSAGNYFYVPNPDELGMSTEIQRETLDHAINSIRSLGVSIYSHILRKNLSVWNTKLHNSIKVEHLELSHIDTMTNQRIKHEI